MCFFFPLRVYELMSFYLHQISSLFSFEQSFSGLLTVWVRWFFVVGGCHMHCRVFRNIFGLHPLDAKWHSLTVTNKNVSWHSQMSGGQKCRWLRTAAFQRQTEYKPVPPFYYLLWKKFDSSLENSYVWFIEMRILNLTRHKPQSKFKYLPWRV